MATTLTPSPLDAVFDRMLGLGRTTDPTFQGRPQIWLPPVDTYETEVRGGRLQVTPHATDRTPRLTLTMAAPELLRLAAGLASGPALFLTRRLKAQGDLLLAGAITRWFDLPRV